MACAFIASKPSYTAVSLLVAIFVVHNLVGCQTGIQRKSVRKLVAIATGVDENTDQDLGIAADMPGALTKAGGEIIVEQYTLFSDGLRLRLYDFYYDKAKSDLVRSPENALFSVAWVVRDEKKFVESRVLVLTERPALDGMKTMLEHNKDPSVRVLAPYTLWEASIFAISSRKIEFGAGIQPALSWIRTKYAQQIIDDPALASGSQKTIFSDTGDTASLQKLLASTVCDFLEEELANAEIQGELRKKLYMIRVLNGRPQTIALAISFYIAMLSVGFLAFWFSPLRTDTDLVRSLERSRPVIAVLSASIPAIGLIGTIYGASNAVISLADMVNDQLYIQQQSTSDITRNLGVAFDTTLVATIAWIIAELLYSFARWVSPDDGALQHD